MELLWLADQTHHLIPWLAHIGVLTAQSSALFGSALLPSAILPTIDQSKEGIPRNQKASSGEEEK